MKILKKLMIVAGLGLTLTACTNKEKEAEFKYCIDQFADIQVLRYRIPGWDGLTLQQKEYIYHLSEAAKAGRDITWDQNFKYNLRVRHLLEDILEKYDGERTGEEWDNFLVYAKRVFFSNGIHHHYADSKIIPGCSREYFSALAEAVGTDPNECKLLMYLIYDPDIFPTKRYQGNDKDLVKASAVNFYEGDLTAAEVNDFYGKMEAAGGEHPVAFGLNSKLVKKNGRIYEEAYRVGGLYSAAIEVIVSHLEKAREVAENELQKKYISELIEYYNTGDLKMWDQYNITWVSDTDSDVDFVNGFVEDYGDPLGRKAHYEGIVDYRDREASRRTEIISSNAQWFEDNSPVDPRFKKKEVKGVSAKVINVAG